MKGKMFQLILGNAIAIGAFSAYMYYLLNLPPCEDQIKLIIKSTPLMIIIIVTIIYDIYLQRKINSEISDKIQKEVENVRNNMGLGKHK